MKTVKLLICAICILIAGIVSANNATPSSETRQDSTAEYNMFIHKADSCYMNQNFELASKFFDKAFSLGVRPIDTHLYNGACAAALSGDENAAFNRLFTRVQLYPRWYSNRIEKDQDLQSLHSSPKWAILCDTLKARQTFFERNYDHALKSRLETIHYRDQDPRNAYISALRAIPQDSVLVRTCLLEMQKNDSINQIEVFEILDSYGWPSTEIVGEYNFAIWEVIQHTLLRRLKNICLCFILLLQIMN